jgi:hypothetical protein
MEERRMEGELTRGGAHGMSQKPEACRQKQPRPLTVSEIRTRVENIAGEAARCMMAGRDLPLSRMGDMEAFPLDTHAFVSFMSQHIQLN